MIIDVHPDHMKRSPLYYPRSGRGYKPEQNSIPIHTRVYSWDHKEDHVPRRRDKH